MEEHTTREEIAKGGVLIIYITGDTHGEHARFTGAQERSWTVEDTIIVCGDFGYIFEDSVVERSFLDDLAQRPYTICFVDGNHENFPAIFRYPEEKWNSGRIHRIRKNIIHLMRGQVFSIDGKRFFTMGGAYSIDRYMRTRNRTYWEEELPNSLEYNEAIKNLKKHDNCVDFILTHTAPREIIRMMGQWPDEHDIELTGFLEYLMHEIEYRHWYFGHWHRDQKITARVTAIWFDTVVIPAQITQEDSVTSLQNTVPMPKPLYCKEAAGHTDSTPSTTGTLLLTSFGLNTTLGADLIAKALDGEDLSAKTILLVSLAAYGIDDLLQSACLKMGFVRENIFFSDVPSGERTEPLCPEYVDYVYVTEGNTFKILHHLRQKDLMPYIRRCVASGSTYIGASAGAMLAGTDVKLALEFDPDNYSTTDFTALGLFNGTIIPHYTADELACFIENSTYEELARYACIYYIENNSYLQLTAIVK